tara:strand:- start:13963 stop:15285 length:1323 start_codon:yes stop_codon:yes gene_type:complete
MKLRISSKEFYSRQNRELERFFGFNKKVLCLSTKSDVLINEDNEFINIIKVDNPAEIKFELSKVKNSYYDLVIVTDLFEVSDDIYDLLSTLKFKLNKSGKILISTINSKWKLVQSLLEFFNLKKKIRKGSNTKLQKIINISRSCGLEFNYFFTKQIFPFKLFGLGNILNNSLEIIFFKFNLGIKSYILFSNLTSEHNPMSKSVIVPAKNESGNLEILFKNFPKLNLLNEIVLICAESEDNTYEVANKIKLDFPELKIKTIEQQSNGKANAVFEALEHTTGELISILDSDISVEPSTLNSFFEIIENGHGDFVNGTRLIYPIEKDSMRKLNIIGNKFFKTAVSLVIQNSLSDSLCGTKVFKKSHVPYLLKWRKDLNYTDPFGDFDFLFSAAYYGEKILEYPVHYKARIYGKTQISRFRDGFKLMVYFIKSFSRFNTSLTKQ